MSKETNQLINEKHPLRRFLDRRGSNTNQLAKMSTIPVTTLRSYISRKTHVFDLPFEVIISLSELDTTHDLNLIRDELIQYEVEYRLFLVKNGIED